MSYREQLLKKIEHKQLSDGCCVVDFYVNDEIEPPLYHYIIADQTSAGILSWGRAISLQEAEDRAVDAMRAYTARSAA